MTKAQARRIARGFIADVARKEAEDLCDFMVETVPDDLHQVCRDELCRIADRLSKGPTP